MIPGPILILAGVLALFIGIALMVTGEEQNGAVCVIVGLFCVISGVHITIHPPSS